MDLVYALLVLIALIAAAVVGWILLGAVTAAVVYGPAALVLGAAGLL